MLNKYTGYLTKQASFLFDGLNSVYKRKQFFVDKVEVIEPVKAVKIKLSYILKKNFFLKLFKNIKSVLLFSKTLFYFYIKTFGSFIKPISALENKISV